MAILTKTGNYLLRVLKGLDRLGNALIGGNDRETLSSVAYRKWRDKEPFGFMMSLINTLFFFQPLHCAQAYFSDRNATLPS